MVPHYTNFTFTFNCTRLEINTRLLGNDCDKTGSPKKHCCDFVMSQRAPLHDWLCECPRLVTLSQARCLFSTVIPSHLTAIPCFCTPETHHNVVLEGVPECGEAVNRWLSMLLSGDLLFLSNSLPKAAAVTCEMKSKNWKAFWPLQGSIQWIYWHDYFGISWC